MRPDAKESPRNRCNGAEGSKIPRGGGKITSDATCGFEGGKKNLRASPEHSGELQATASALSAGVRNSAIDGSSGLGMPGTGVCPPSAGIPRLGLPCQNRNNSTKRYHLRRSSKVLYRLQGAGHEVRSVCSDPVLDRDGRLWDEHEDGQCWILGGLNGSEAKSAFQLRGNVASFVQKWGRNHCAFFTLTDQSGSHPKEFAKRWNSFRTHEGSKVFGSWIRVLEPQKRGRPHYHLLVAVPWDMRPDSFDWEAFFEAQREFSENGRTDWFRECTKLYKESAGVETVAVWKWLRKVLPKYGLGRAEFLPVRKGHEALSEYVGKYLEAGLQVRRHDWKGVRRVETDRKTSQEWKTHQRQFSWVSPGAAFWRQRVGEIAAALGITSVDFAALRQRLGSRWAYFLRGAIILSDDDQWQDVISSMIAAVDGMEFEVEPPEEGWGRLPKDWHRIVWGRRMDAEAESIKGVMRECRRSYAWAFGRGG